jgi:hypothetical protein
MCKRTLFVSLAFLVLSTTPVIGLLFGSSDRVSEHCVDTLTNPGLCSGGAQQGIYVPGNWADFALTTCEGDLYHDLHCDEKIPDCQGCDYWMPLENKVCVAWLRVNDDRIYYCTGVSGDPVDCGARKTGHCIPYQVGLDAYNCLCDQRDYGSGSCSFYQCTDEAIRGE